MVRFLDDLPSPPRRCLSLRRLSRHAFQRIVGAAQRVGQQQDGHSFLQTAVAFGNFDGLQGGIEPYPRPERQPRAKDLDFALEKFGMVGRELGLI